MQTQQMNSKKLSNKQIKLVDGEFLKSQALEILSSLIDQKINYHKVDGLQMWESNHDIDKTHIHNRIDALEKEKADLHAYVKSLTSNDIKLKVKGVLEIEVIDKW